MYNLFSVWIQIKTLLFLLCFLVSASSVVWSDLINEAEKVEKVENLKIFKWKDNIFLQSSNSERCYLFKTTRKWTRLTRIGWRLWERERVSKLLNFWSRVHAQAYLCCFEIFTHQFDVKKMSGIQAIMIQGEKELYKRQFFGFGSALPILEIE